MADNARRLPFRRPPLRQPDIREAAIKLAFAVASDALAIANRLRSTTKPANIRKAYDGISAAHRGRARSLCA